MLDISAEMPNIASKYSCRQEKIEEERKKESRPLVMYHKIPGVCVWTGRLRANSINDTCLLIQKFRALVIIFWWVEVCKGNMCFPQNISCLLFRSKKPEVNKVRTAQYERHHTWQRKRLSVYIFIKIFVCSYFM